MIAYLSEKADNRIINSLKEMGFELKLLSPFSALANPVSTHADMLLCAVEDTIFHHKDYNCETIGFNQIFKIEEPISEKYPNDVLLNIAVVGKHVFANSKYASKTIVEFLKEKGYLVHHVQQGYAHCSTCIVNENAIITADKGIAITAQNNGVDALLISEGHISLPPYNHGFIGGACGTTSNALYFCGSLNYHPDGDKIRAFITNHGKDIIELSDSPLIDIGGILFI